MDLVATELLRLVGEHEQQKDPLNALAGSLDAWFDFQANSQRSPV